MKILKNSLFVVLILAVFSYCTVKKRAYRKGYYIEWAKHLSHSTLSVMKEKKKSQSLSKEVNVKKNDTYTDSETELASNENAQLLMVKPKKRQQINNVDCGDVIVMKNGEEITGKVVEINETEVKYKLCSDLDGPSITLNKKDVFMIKYTNGSKEILKSETDEKKAEKKKDKLAEDGKPKPEGNAITGLIFSIIGALLFFVLIPLLITFLGTDLLAAVLAFLLMIVVGVIDVVFSLIGLILGGIGLNRILENPQKYKGKYMAIASMVISGLAIMAIVIFFAIASQA